MIGQTVGSYRVLARLGEGGMGVVYKALDVRLHRHVALKALSAESSTDEQRRRFLQEARAASALNDPHIVTIHDILTEGGTDYLVMELVEGRTLREIVMDGPVPVSRALDWTAQIAEALALAHSAGIVHRDLKPANVMVTSRGLVKILDFGIAKIAPTSEEETADALTRVNAVMGTADYMSPEQARGAQLDHRSDIFSLGAIFYELLTGIRAFQGANTLARLHAVLNDPIVPVRTHNSSIPEEVDAIVRKTLERPIEHRYQTMDRLALDIRAVMSAAPSTVASSVTLAPTAVPAVASGDGRRWVWAVAGVAVVVVAIVGAVQSGVWPGRDNGMPEPAAIVEPANAFEHTQVGLGLLQRYNVPGNVDKAIVAFEAAVALDKAFAPAWAGLARAYWRQQKTTRDQAWSARAIDAATQAVALNPYLSAAHVSLGFAQLEASDRPAATATLNHALVLDPNNADAVRGLGELAEREGRLDDAAAHYAKAVNLAPGDWEFAVLAGNIPYRAGRYAEALDWYQKAVAASPDNAVPLRLLGAANHMIGDYGAAASAFQKSIAIQPTAATYTNLGTALFYQGQYRESLPAFEKAVEMAPSNPVNWGNMADAYRWVPGNRKQSEDAYQRAIQLLDQALAKDAVNVQNRSRLALFLAKSGDKTRALSEVRRVLSGEARDVNSLYRAAVTYDLCGDRARALATLEQALTGGYALAEVKTDPELTDLRSDVRYHRLAARFEPAAVNK